MSEAQELRERAAQAEERARASWERSDTDGLLSQWASGISADLYRTQADLLDRGGVHRFRALFTTAGHYVPAKTIESRYGQRWMVLDERGRATGTFLPYAPKRRDTLAKRGYVEGWVMRPAEAVIAGHGTGLSGAASAYVDIVPTDRPTDYPAEILSTDRWSEEQGS